ncbi:MAG: glycosyltransferase family 4 protein [Glaciimonas sp.]|nr:glycosyltransferase family 4 protein [Glaciimonas sp.]
MPWRSHTKPLHFIFAGSLSHRKAIDIILAAFTLIKQSGLHYQLSFVGGEGEPGWIKQIEKTPNARYIPGIPQNVLYGLIGEADCLLLPSRFDSFGMVVAEAMACGTPVIVSTQTGAKAILEKFPGAGWIVDPDVQSLYRCVKARIDDRASIFSARAYALQAANHFTWAAYRERVGSYLENWMTKE